MINIACSGATLRVREATVVGTGCRGWSDVSAAAERNKTRTGLQNVLRSWFPMHNQGTFRVTLSMRKEPQGGPVFCKMETTRRFKQPKTVKLQTDTTYRMDVSFKPPRALQSLVIFGQEMEPCEKSRDSTACAYSSYYNTNGLMPSKKGQRQDLIIVMKVQGSGELSTCLQIKLYKQHDTQHCEWGSRLHCIELDCCADEGAMAVTVNKETYRKLGLDC